MWPSVLPRHRTSSCWCGMGRFRGPRALPKQQQQPSFSSLAPHTTVFHTHCAPCCCCCHMNVTTGSLLDKNLPPKHRQAGAHLFGHLERQVEPCTADPHCAAQVGEGLWQVAGGRIPRCCSQVAARLQGYVVHNRAGNRDECCACQPTPTLDTLYGVSSS